MTRPKAILIGFTLVLLVIVSCTWQRGEQPAVVRYQTTKRFSDVVEELNFAITEHNFRITGRNSIGAGIRKRGYQDFPNVEVIHFCSLEYARRVLAVDPGFVAYMPCRITVHEERDKVIISVIRVPQDHTDQRVRDFASEMNRILEEIVSFALEENA